MDRLKEVASVFFKLGCVAFGGPAAHIAMMEEEVVSKRKWMSREHFLDLVGATNLIPGPNSTEMAIHCGFHRAGWLGLIVSGACFIFPAVVLTGVLAAVFVKYGQLPEVMPFVYGIRPAVIAIIASAILKLGKKALKGWELGLIGSCVLVASLAGVSEVVAILVGGFAGMVFLSFTPKSTKNSFLSISPLIFIYFLKIGSILFGSGYVLIAYLQGGLVEQLGWITEQQLLDAVAIGQLTPGPVLSTATFIGYQIHGWQGAIYATLGIFLPSFVFVALLNPIIPHLRKYRWTARFLDAVNISAVGIMLSVLIQLIGGFAGDWRSLVIAGIALFLVFYVKKANPIILVCMGSIFGYILQLF